MPEVRDEFTKQVDEMIMIELENIKLLSKAKKKKGKKKGKKKKGKKKKGLKIPGYKLVANFSKP